MLLNYLDKIIPIPADKHQDISRLIVSRQEKHAGEYFVKQGELCKKLFFLQEGIAKMVYEKDGKSFVKDFIFKNDFASVYESFINRKPARYALKAVTNCEYDIITYENLQKALVDIPALKEIKLILTENIYLNMSGRFESLITLSAKERYLELLERRPNLSSEIPQYMIASYLGITDVALSRIRGKLAKK